MADAEDPGGGVIDVCGRRAKRGYKASKLLVWVTRMMSSSRSSWTARTDRSPVARW